MDSVFSPMVAFMCTILAVSSSVASAQSAVDPLGHRIKLSFFEYAGSQQGEPKIYFSRFKGILRDKLTVLVEELPDARDQFEYLQRLSLDPPGDGGFEDRLTTEASLQSYWDQSRSLLLFRGTLSSEVSGSYFAQSRLYLGSLHGGISHPSIAMRLPIHVEEFPITSDTHSLIVYYVLAQDAIRMKDDRSRVIELLGRAQDKVHDLKRQNALSPSISEVSKAIEQALLTERALAPNP